MYIYIIDTMVIRKVIKFNKTGAKGVCIPAEMLKDFGLTEENSFVNIEKVGNSIHINRVEVVL